jgi:hypothetical protein
MYTNPTKYEYRPAENLPNTVAELPKDYAADITFRVHPPLVDLITAVRKSRPGWKYKADYATNTNFRGQHKHTVGKLTVFDGDEGLGKVWVDHTYEDGNLIPVYCVGNARIDRSLKRKRHVESKKLQVAAKHMVKSFYSKTVDEKVNEIARPAFHIATNAAVTLINADAKAGLGLISATMAFAFANEDAFLAGVSPPERELFLKRKAFRQEQADVSRFRDGNKLVFIDQGGGKYIRALVRSNADILSSDEVTLDQMPEHQKLSLSILKLQDAGAGRFVVGHGVCVDETTFVTGA